MHGMGTVSCFVNRVKKETFAELLAGVASGQKIADFYFGFLSAVQINQLLLVAKENRNRLFYAQVQSVVKRSAKTQAEARSHAQQQGAKRPKKRKQKKRFVEVSPKESLIVRLRNRGFGGGAGGVRR